MKNESQPQSVIPEAEDNATASQSESDSRATHLPALPPGRTQEVLGGEPFVEAFDYLANSQARRLGGDVAAPLVAAIARTIVSDRRTVEDKNTELLQQNGKLREELGQTRTDLAVCAQKLESEREAKSFRNLSSVAGTATFSLAVSLFTAGHADAALPLALIGVALIAAAWFIRPKA